MSARDAVITTGRDGPAAGAEAVARQSRRDDRKAGVLVLIGGALNPAGPALDVFLRLSGAREGAKIVGFTTASADPMGSAVAWKDAFASAGAANVEFPIIDRRSRAQDARIAQMVLDAQGIFLGGGDQVHLVATLSGSRVRSEERRVGKKCSCRSLPC